MAFTMDDSQFTIDTESPIPLYHQIKQNLRELMDSEVLTSGQALPSERKLAEVYGVNRLTARRAVGDLVREGLLIRQRGVGTFVAEPKLIQNMQRVQGFSERVRESGRAPSSRLISLETTMIPVHVAQRTDMPAETQIYKLVRLRSVDGEPVILETAYLPQERFPDLSAVDFSAATLYQILAERYDCVPAESEETLEPVILTDYEQELLETDTGALGMLVEAVTRNQVGHVVEFSHSIVRGDRCRYFFHIRRSPKET